MSFDPKSFINVSKELKTGITEAHYRTTVNRAYYGVFGHIRNKLGLYVDNASAHKELIKSLRNSPKINEKKAGSRLETLFKKRKDADYKYNLEIKQNTCDFTIQEAEAIIDLFDNPEE